MSDVIDDANDRAQSDLDRAIEAARRNVTPAVPLPEYCLNDCGEKPRERSRYCSPDCRGDHEERLLLLKRQGRP